MRRRGIGVDDRFESLNAPGQEQVLPRCLRSDDEELRRLLETVSGAHAPCRSVFGADELIERPRKRVPERYRPQDGMDAGQVVVHPRAMDTDDLSQRRLHQRKTLARHTERASEVAEVVVIAKARDGIEQRRDW